jgi:hypothetical protein
MKTYAVRSSEPPANIPETRRVTSRKYIVKFLSTPFLRSRCSARYNIPAPSVYVLSLRRWVEIRAHVKQRIE